MSELSIQIYKNGRDGLHSVDLNNCDREPIHIPEHIQPYGLLLVLDEPDLHIVQASENALEILGIVAADLLDRPLADFISSDLGGLIELTRACQGHNFENVNPLRLSISADITNDRTSRYFNGIIHRAPSSEIVLELEPLEANVRGDFFQFYRQIKFTLAKMQAAQSLAALCDFVVKEMREITEYDRVMIYRFDEGGDGTVIAESKQDYLEPLLGLHYPDSDIPKQAKHLYTLKWLRLLSDVNDQPIGLVKTNAKSQQPLDMSYCGLRAMSPIHIEYLKNMGVVATMTISLMQNQKLWGLIACHHNTPKLVPYEIRTVCEFLSQLMSTELVNKGGNENIDYKLHLKTIQVNLIERLIGTTDFFGEITKCHETLLALTGATGAAVCDGDNIISIGSTPSNQSLTLLIKSHIPLVMEGKKQLGNRSREQIVTLAGKGKEI